MWKRIDGLREAGIAIVAAPGRGYRLEQPLDLLDADAIRAALPRSAQDGLAGLEIAWSLDSTNSELLRRAAPPHGSAVLLAERQTGGRGRRGRQGRRWRRMCICAAGATFRGRAGAAGRARPGLRALPPWRAARAWFAEVGLKWPNDLVVVDDKGLRKLGGLLVEGGGEAAGAARAVIGIGLTG